MTSQRYGIQRASEGHHLARRQMSQHGVDRFPTVEKNLKQLSGELIELALAIAHAEAAHGQPGLDPEVRHEAADVGLTLHHLLDKLDIDLIEVMRELVENDNRRFT